jgi:hypothetical protein
LDGQVVQVGEPFKITRKGKTYKISGPSDLHKGGCKCSLEKIKK